MSFQHKVFLLKLALSVVLVGTGILKLIEPVAWVTWIPDWFANVTTINKDHLIFITGTFELFVGIWLLVPWYSHITASIATVYICMTLLFEVFNRSGIQHAGLVVLSIALVLFTWPKKLHLTYQDH